ncbi:MAG TPA: T9SS type A sorting domain-containing protein, partial [Bacteroidales bacterium]|nr:T9SS type A sorting domain-containing protein [Bacteroidales bacterium]
QYAIQPITVVSQYHYFSNVDTVLYFPIQQYDTLYINPNYSLIVYPNPCTEYIVVSFTKTVESTIQVRIINSFGHIVSNEMYYLQNGVFTINTQNVPKGLYILEIEVKGKIISKKFIKM